MRRSVVHSLAVLLMLTLVIGSSVHAQVMNSTNYRIDIDSVNVGGVYGTSTLYTLEDSVGEVGTGYSSSTNYTVHAGYQQMEETYITLSSPADVNLANISGFLGGTSSSTVQWTVTTNNASGYSLAIKATSSPALKASSTAAFANYTPAGGDPDYTFSVPATASEFGFSPEGTEIVARYRDDGVSACNSGSGNTPNTCWDPLSTSDTTIAARASANAPAGTPTTVRIRAEIGNNKFQDSGEYTATLVVTALSL